MSSVRASNGCIRRLERSLLGISGASLKLLWSDDSSDFGLLGELMDALAKDLSGSFDETKASSSLVESVQRVKVLIYVSLPARKCSRPEAY